MDVFSTAHAQQELLEVNVQPATQLGVKVKQCINHRFLNTRQY